MPQFFLRPQGLLQIITWPVSGPERPETPADVLPALAGGSAPVGLCRVEGLGFRV